MRAEDRVCRAAERWRSAYADALSMRWGEGGLPRTVGRMQEAGVHRDRAQRVAVACHLFYPDLLEEVLVTATRVPPPVDLLVTVIAPEIAQHVEAALSSWTHGRSQVRVVPNRGRDVAPKYVAFPELYSGSYDLVLFLHTKKSTNPVLGPMWREHLFGALAGSEERVRQILDAFDEDDRLGVVAPEHFPPVRPWTGWNGNFAQVLRLAGRMGIEVRPWQPPDFPSGSMFWARPSALAPIVRLALTSEDFPEEPAPPSGTTMHALERLVYASAAVGGFSAASVPGPPVPRGLAADSTTLPPAPSGRPTPNAVLRSRAFVDAVRTLAREQFR